MLDLQKFFHDHDFDNLVKRLEQRGLSKEELSFIRKKLAKKNELIKIINELRQERNQLSQEGQKNAEKVKKIREEISSQEQELNNLEQELNNLTNLLPNLPAPNTPTNQEGNKIIDIVEYSHNIQHNLKNEEILKK